MGLENFLSVNSFGAFQPYSTSTRGKIMKEVEVERVERVEERGVEEEKDCEIIRISKKITAPMKKVVPKKKPTQVEVKEEGNRNWLDSEVYQLIALKGEMEPELKGTTKNEVNKPLT